MAAKICIIFGILAILGVRLTQGRVSRTVRLDVINHAILNVVVFVGEKLNLRCQNFNFETKWYKDDEELHKSTSRIRINKQLLKFKYVEMEDTGVYSCRSESNETIEWKNVTIHVENVQNGFQNEGEHKSGAMNVLRPEDENNDLETETRKLPETRLLHLDSEILDAGLDEKSKHDAEDVHNLVVPDSPPSFNKTDEITHWVVKPAGSTMRLKCPAWGNPKPNITWLKNNEEPRRDLGTVIRSKWTLRLEELVTKDSGNYTCIVCNYLGCINYTFKVDIIERFPHKPYINKDFPKNMTALINSTATFRCPIVSDLEPYIQWVKVAEYPGDQQDLSKGTFLQAGMETENPEELKLYNVTEKDEGWYTCIAQNTLGETFSSAYLHVVETLDEQRVSLATRPQIVVNVLTAILCVFFAMSVVKLISP